MALRLIEVFHEGGKAEEIKFLLQDINVIHIWHDELPDGETVTKILLTAETTESIIDTLQTYFVENQTRIVILPVEATLPRPERPEEEGKKEKTPQRISTEELYQKMKGGSGITKKYIIMAVLASLVAAIGLLKNDVAVIIGSMVIAPLLSPNMALSLATTLADFPLAWRSMRTNMVGFLLVLGIGIIMGLVMTVDPTVQQIASRSDVSHFYIFLALAAGVAGAYSMTTGVSEALVGVMVAVALLPPLVASGLLLGSGHIIEAAGALLLFFVNLVCVNLAGVVTFLFEGIQPKNWWEAERARKAVRIAILIWGILLMLLALMIFFEQQLKSS